MTASYATELPSAVDAGRTDATTAPDAERAFAHVFSLLERLADVLAAPPDAGGASTAEFESAVCGYIAHMRGAGVTREQLTARLVRLVQTASARHRTQEETAGRVAAVVGWCERAELASTGARQA